MECPVITIFFTELFTEFLTISGHNHIFYRATYRVFDWIVTNYILTNCLKIQQNFLKYYKLYWINSEGYNLNFTVFYSIQVTVRHLFLFCGILESIPNCINYQINDRVSTAKTSQCCNITIAREGQFQIQEVLCKIGYFGLLHMSRTDFYPDSFIYYTGMALD